MKAGRLVLTGGIACGKSRVSRLLNARGVETLDADDIVHELIPEPERRRLAPIVFRDPAARAALEARVHPVVRARLEAWQDAAPPGIWRMAVVPLLFECNWAEKYDIICCVVSDRDRQLARMETIRGYSREEAEARLAAQMPTLEKAARSHYVIENNGSLEDLQNSVERFVLWLKS